MEQRVERRRGGERRQSGGGSGGVDAVSGTEEQSAGQIQANTATLQVFPDVRVLPVVFLLWLSDLGAGNSHHML